MTDHQRTPTQHDQLIDIRAGTILRDQARRKESQYLGCPVNFLLIFVVLVKCSLITIWIIHEYETFDFRCSAIEWTNEIPNLSRVKRWDPRRQSHGSNKTPLHHGSKRRNSSLNRTHVDPSLDFGPLPPIFGGNYNKMDDGGEAEELSTMVTLTNTQVIPNSGGGSVKMKTIRNRVERVGSDEEQFMEIEIENAPTIYVSKIKSRHEDQVNTARLDEQDFEDLKRTRLEDNERRRERKKKKKNKLMKGTENVEETTEREIKKKKKKKNDGLTKEERRKIRKNKKKNGSNHLTESSFETTKIPRHLLAGAINSPTPSPEHKIPVKEGQIRDFRLSPATKVPTTRASISVEDVQSTTMIPTNTIEEEEVIRLSSNTRLMWDMDEKTYTTFISPKTTQSTSKKEEIVEQEKVKEDEEEQQQENIVEEKKQFMAKPMLEPTTETYHEVNDADTETVHINKLNTIYNQPKEHFPTNQKIWTQNENVRHENEVLRPVQPPLYTREWHSSSFALLTTTSMPPATTQSLEIYDPKHFQAEIDRLKSSTICLARMAFNVWCLFMLFSCLPFLSGICVPRWSLFVFHIVFDFLFIIITFVSSMTIAIMAIIVYFSINEMTIDQLLQFILVSCIIDVVLLIYSLIVFISYRCCCRLVNNAIKDANSNLIGVHV